MLYTLAPDLLLGWPRANRANEREFLLPDVGARPEVGRITGRGNTGNLEEVLALKPDLILDIGTINPTFVSLADRVHEQTGIPYALLDGRFDELRRLIVSLVSSSGAEMPRTHSRAMLKTP
jgi:iron complex transport system substrate-binding protein